MSSLVSVIVITFNSSKFILETLESIKNQTYENIELIVTDDSSSDDTVEKCTNWIKTYNSRFVNVTLVCADKNTGVAGNCNRGLDKATGFWIKFIAGDDTLKANCINQFINFATLNNSNVVHSALDVYNDTLDDHGYDKTIRKQNEVFNDIDISAAEQYKFLLLHNPINALTAFFKSTIFDKVGTFDTNFPMLEDYPLWLRITKSGIKIDYMDISTVNYRIHGNSLSNFRPHTITTSLDGILPKFYSVYVYPYIGFWKTCVFKFNLWKRVKISAMMSEKNFKLLFRLNEFLSMPNNLIKLNMKRRLASEINYRKKSS
jgi:alpha-1,3-rhamnosyltransferase